MAVVVNEFEVVPADDDRPAPAAQPGSPAPATPPADEVERLLRRLHERAVRLRAD